MWLTDIEVDRGRLLNRVQLSLAEGLTMVIGRNGHGKTSLLEAIYLLGTGRSFRTRRLDDLVAWSGGPLRIVGQVQARNRSLKLSFLMDNGERRMLVNGAERELEGFIGRLDVVDLTGDRMNVLRGGPEERRRFLDRGIVGLDPAYLLALGEYRRILNQRNALLRRGAVSEDELAAWDSRLVVAGAVLHDRRRDYASRLRDALDEAAAVLFNDGASLDLVYRPSPPGSEDEKGDDFKDNFDRALKEARSRDRALGYTGRGPHRDELRVELDEIDLRRFGSAGQLRASMVALKLGKLSVLHKDRGDAPLFLMDDFDSDLDEVRAAALTGFLHKGGFQAIVATSKEGLADRLAVPFSKVLMDSGEARTA